MQRSSGCDTAVVHPPPAARRQRPEDEAEVERAAGIAEMQQKGQMRLLEYKNQQLTGENARLTRLLSEAQKSEEKIK